MTHLEGELCRPPYYDLLLVPVELYRENPAFPVNEGYEAYTTIAECQKLVYDTLGHIARTYKYKHILPVKASWDANLGADTHGVAEARGGVKKPKEVKIKLNPIVFYYETPENRAQTIIHESCHIANFLLEEDTEHGKEWIRLMKLCGIPPRECAYRPLAMCWHGKCSKCGGIWAVHTKDALAKIKRGTHAPICRNCGNRIKSIKGMVEPTMKPNEWKKYIK